MTSTSVLGWGGHVIGIVQNGAITAIFGSNFKNGNNYGP